ncbi:MULTISPECIES: cbb3-type cytochrome oxidase subunit 3 [Vibrio]|uniref:Cbb3-type cytochrome oxidase subunit 3 n=1 Tax=Vibrio casei TaxID=673372 RepID=A0A368LN78_9VIBR|nr:MULTISPECIES: CcoQ/FixQ family Cbb3-type cytochrome c oxidase assembly chaperone [Vibrio]RCS73246.1 cbb3-type cytochrome oxidase subunit 3 [Vibrio casei]HBV75710.1 cbb3-type cytochrome oxidase subunit 3 [Vibrio sp.]
MDIITLHSIWTLVLFISFCGVLWWACGKNRQSRFDEAANLIFDDEPEESSKEQKQGGMK